MLGGAGIDIDSKMTRAALEWEERNPFEYEDGSPDPLLRALRELRAAHNMLTSVSSEIAQLRMVRIVELDDNALAELPREITQLRLCEVLTLARNRLEALPPGIGALGARPAPPPPGTSAPASGRSAGAAKSTTYCYATAAGRNITAECNNFVPARAGSCLVVVATWDQHACGIG